MKKYAVVITIVAMVLASVAYAEECSILCNPKGSVNIRMNPSRGSATVGVLYCGDKIKTDGKTKTDGKGTTWVHIVDASCEMSEAWVCSAYVQEGLVEVPEDAVATVVAKGRTAIRKSPGGKVVKWVHNCDDLHVLAISNEWVLTPYGYISAKCVEVWYGYIDE